jgi:hypothetical protein
MSQSLIIGASIIGGIGLLSLAMYKFNHTNDSTIDLSSHSLAQDLGYGSRNASTDSSGYYSAQDEIIGGKTKRKKRKNKTKKK